MNIELVTKTWDIAHSCVISWLTVKEAQLMTSYNLYRSYMVQLTTDCLEYD